MHAFRDGHAPAPVPARHAWLAARWAAAGAATVRARISGENSRLVSPSLSTLRTRRALAATRHLLIDQLAADVEQPAVLHARRTGGFARSAGETPIEMQLGLRGGLDSFEHLLDEIDAAARSVELVAEQLIRRTRRRAETAMHALAEDGLASLPSAVVLDEVGEPRFA